ncbi:MAG: carboxypeptidase-like regulatory domain-containing protein [Bacteroidetes bacterium]|nr:carboxypeptidase-like regulatory domain-containing protein [Bacteroidota bacterium]
MRIRHIIIFISFIIPVLVWGQNRSNVYQISGMVISKTNGEPIPYVRVQVNHTRHGAVSNSEGFYSIPVGLGDTLYFTHIGFHESKLIIRDYMETYKGDKSQYIYVVNYLLEDDYYLDPVNIFPYDTPEELRTAVVNMEVITNSPEQIARQNLDPETLHTIMETLPVDGGERLMVARQMYYDYYQTKNLIPTIGFDPVAATRLLQYIVDRSKKKKNKDLNYWQD